MKYRRIKVNFLIKFKHGLSFGIKTFLFLTTVLLGTVFGYIEVTDNKLTVSCVLWLVLISLIVSSIVAYIKGKASHLPEQIIFDTDVDKSYQIQYEPTEVCNFFNEETSNYFGRDFVENEIVEKWRIKNPKGFIYLKNQLNEPCAALCVFGLRDSFMSKFIKGKLTEHDIDTEDVLSFSSSKKSANLYLAAIIVKDPHTIIGNKRAIIMIWGLIQYIKTIYGLNIRRKIYAIPVNVASENLLKKFGFEIVTFAKCRRDKHNLYALDLNRENINTALMRIGDCSHLCTLKL